MSSFARQDFRKIRVAAVQAESIFLDLDATTELACKLIADAASQGAQLIAFPEAFIPTFPNWYETLPEGGAARALDKRLFLNSVEGKRPLNTHCVSATIGFSPLIPAFP